MSHKIQAIFITLASLISVYMMIFPGCKLSPSGPLANFSVDLTSVIIGNPIHFADLSTNNPLSWAWDFNNDGKVDSTLQNPKHFYSSVGTYSVKLKVSNAVGSDEEIRNTYIEVIPETWVDLNSGTNTAEFNGLFALDSNTVWVVGRNKTASPYTDVIYKTTDGGATWKVDKTTPDSNIALNEVYFVDANTGWVVGDKGVIRKTTDGGLTWTAQISGYENTSMTLYDVQFNNSNQGWICGGNLENVSEQGVVLYTTDGGATWKSTLKTGGILKSIDLTSTNTGWTWGRLGQIYYSEPSMNSHWIPQTVGDQNIFFYDGDSWDDNTGWCVGKDGAIFKTTDAGKKWIKQNSGLDYNNTLTSISILDKDVAYTVGVAGTILYTINGGTNWLPAATPYPITTTLNTVDFVNQYVGYSAGSSGIILKYYVELSAPIAAFSTDKTSAVIGESIHFTDLSDHIPTSWEWDFDNNNTIDSILQNPVYVYQSSGTYTVKLTVANMNGSDEEIKTDYITIVKSYLPVADFTANKTSVMMGEIINFTDKSINNPASWAWDFDNNNTVDSNLQNPMYSYPASGTYTIKLTVTNTHGSDSEIKNNYIVVTVGAWSLLDSGSTTAEFHGLFALDANTVWIVGRNKSTTPYTDVVYKTTDGGVTWTVYTTSPDSNISLQEVYFVNANTGWVIGEKGTIRKTADGGITWAAQVSGFEGYRPGPYGMTLYDIQFVDENVGWICGGDLTTYTENIVLYTNNGGTTWTVQSRTDTGYLLAIDFVNSTTGWAWGKNGNICHSTNSGTTWNSQALANPVYFIFDGDAWDVNIAWCSGKDGVIFRTNNAGVSWTQQESTVGSGITLRGICMLDANTAYAVGVAGTILYTNDGGTIWQPAVIPYPVTTTTWYDVDFVSHYAGYIAGTDGKIAKYIAAS